MLVSEFLSMWLSIYSCRLKPHSQSGYSINFNHVNSFIGDMQLNLVKSFDVQNIYSVLLQTLKRNTVLYVHRCFREAMQYAVSLGYISKNPCDGLIVPKKERFVPSIVDEEAGCRLLEYAKTTDYDMYVVLLLALSLGLRRGEIIGLMYSDIDHNLKTISVKRTTEIIHGSFVDSSPKTKAGNRNLLLSDNLYRIIMEYRGKSNRICRLLQNQITYRFKKILIGAELSYMRFHDLRHSCATLLLKKGIAAKIVSERLGHSSITVTLDLYSHVLTDMQEPAALAVDCFVNNPKVV